MNLQELLQYCKDNAADAQTQCSQTAEGNQERTNPEPPQSHSTENADLADSTTADRAAINRANAQHSTGPKSSLGKSRSALNAVKTALTGRTVLLESDDVALYEQHVRGWFTELNPEGLHETTLVQSIADSHWRNDRIVTIEAALFARGRINHRWENVNCYEHEAAGPTEITVLTDVQVNTIYERQLRNLHIQENRLRRQRDNDLKQLLQLQAARKEAAIAEAKAEEAAKPKSLPPATKQQKPGFVFATPKSISLPAGRSPKLSRRKGRKVAQKKTRKAA